MLSSCGTHFTQKLPLASLRLILHARGMASIRVIRGKASLPVTLPAALLPALADAEVNWEPQHAAEMPDCMIIGHN